MKNNDTNLNIRISSKTREQMNIIKNEQSVNWSNLIKQFIDEQIKIRSKQ